MDWPIKQTRTLQLVKDKSVCLFNDERGFIVSLELILIATILVIGLIAGLTALRDAIVSELSDVAQSVQQANQSYQFNGVSSQSASTAGSGFADHQDPPSNVDHCIVVFGTADEL